MKMARLGKRIGVSAFTKHQQFRRDLLVILTVSKSGLTSPDAHTPTRFPSRRRILIATIYLLFRGQDTILFGGPLCRKRNRLCRQRSIRSGISDYWQSK